jgi:hypothetical protein
MKSPERTSSIGNGLRRPTLDELDRPDSVWNRAAAEAARADPFCCRTEWQLSFHEAFAPRRPLGLREGGGSVVALAKRWHPATGPLLEPVESHWLFGSPLLGAHAVEVLDAFLGEDALRRESPSVLVSALLPGGRLVRSLTRTFASRYEIVRLGREVLCSASLEGGLDGFLSRRSARLRKRLRQAERRAAASGVRFERALSRTAAEAGAVFARMLTVERASWKGRERSGIVDPPSRVFYAKMLERLSRSTSARVIFARCEDDDVGFIFGGLAGAVYRGQQFSFTDDWRPFSIGNLLQLEQVRWLCEEGAVRYDMGPLMEYKRHWTETQTRIGARLLRPRSDRL